MRLAEVVDASARVAATRSRNGAEASRLRPEWTWKSAEMAPLVRTERLMTKSTGVVAPAVTVICRCCTLYSMPRAA